MNSLISLKYIHWFELDLKKGYRLNAAGVKHNLIVRNMTGLVAEKTPKQRTVFPEHWISIKYHRLSTPSRWMIRLHQDFKKGRDPRLEKKSVKQKNIDHMDYHIQFSCVCQLLPLTFESKRDVTHSQSSS